jgi:hypothetical protein
MHRNGTAISNHQPGLGLIHHEWRSDHQVASRDLLVNEHDTRDRSSTSMVRYRSSTSTKPLLIGLTPVARQRAFSYC